MIMVLVPHTASPAQSIMSNDDLAAAETLGHLLSAHVIFVRTDSARLDDMHGSRREQALRSWIVSHYPSLAARLNAIHWADIQACMHAALGEGGAAVLLSSSHEYPLVCLIEAKPTGEEDCTPPTMAHRRLTTLARALNSKDVVFMRRTIGSTQPNMNIHLFQKTMWCRSLSLPERRTGGTGRPYPLATILPPIYAAIDRHAKPECGW